ncbi:MAG TPA: hypothetical protein VFQ27_07985 [Xanthobacteraceae bacterium]|nr:hypothetical protein [Xanthobacteraceae bacterium]
MDGSQEKERMMTTDTQPTIDRYGDPLGFKFREGARRSALAGLEGRDVVKVEARQMAGHQKEAVVTDGAEGPVWRLTSDEGTHLRGTDLAPFPLGFFNAGMQADLYQRIRALAAQRRIGLGGVEIWLVNHYWLTGSFVHGTGEGHAEPSDIEVRIRADAGREAVERMVVDALDASPAVALQRQALAGNTFALYINGRRRPVADVPSSNSEDAADPYRVYTHPPRPLAGAETRNRLIEKTGSREDGAAEPAPATVSGTGRLIRNINGLGRSRDDGLFEVETWLGLPGASHFRLLSDPDGEAAPSGLALLSAGIAFCYMTQLSRYIESMKMRISGARLVQFNPFVAAAAAAAEPIDTHLFLNGEAPEETHRQLLTVAARTCYLHAAAKAPLDPQVRIVHNGAPIERAA